MTNHQNRRLAQAAGYYIAEGSYHGTTDDRIYRWYVGRDGEPFRPCGPGHRTKDEAWATAAEQARMDQDARPPQLFPPHR